MKPLESDALAFAPESMPLKRFRADIRIRQFRAALSSIRQPEPFDPADESLPEAHLSSLEASQAEARRLYERASLCIERSQYPLAVSLLRRVVTGDAPNVQAWVALGLAFGELGRRVDSVECFDRALEIDPTMAAAWSNRGSQKLRNKDLKGAAHDLAQALDLDPSDAVAWSQLGLALERSRKPLEALEAYRAAADADPLVERYLLDLARCCARLKRREESVHWLARAIDINAGCWQAWLMLAIRVRDWGEWPMPAPHKKPKPDGAVSSEAQSYAVGRIIVREALLEDRQAIRRQEKAQNLLRNAQNPVAWMLLLIVVALLYVLLGK